VFIQWFFSFATRGRGARLITEAAGEHGLAVEEPEARGASAG
jgi:hypothetical protein